MGHLSPRYPYLPRILSPRYPYLPRILSPGYPYLPRILPPRYPYPPRILSPGYPYLPRILSPGYPYLPRILSPGYPYLPRILFCRSNILWHSSRYRSWCSATDWRLPAEINWVMLNCRNMWNERKHKWTECWGAADILSIDISVSLSHPGGSKLCLSAHWSHARSEALILLTSGKLCHSSFLPSFSFLCGHGSHHINHLPPRELLYLEETTGRFLYWHIHHVN